MNEEATTDEQRNENLRDNVAALVHEGVYLMILARSLLMVIANAENGKVGQEAIEGAKKMLEGRFASPSNFVSARIMSDTVDAMENLGQSEE